MDHIDPDELAKLLKDLHQGDIVDIGKYVRLYSPDVPTWPEEVEAAPHEEPAMTADGQLDPPLSVVITQDCDLRRGIEIEPFVILAPLTKTTRDRYDLAARGLSVRYFAYPSIGGHELLVLDMRVLSSLEKTALLSPDIKRMPCPLSEPGRAGLRQFLGDRFGRTPFPEEIDRQVITPITQAIRRMSENTNGACVLAATVYAGLSWTPGRRYVSLLLLVDNARLSRCKMNEDNVAAGLTALRKALNHFARNSAYTIVANAHDATEVSAAQLLSHEELQLDVDQVDMESIAERASAGRAEVAEE